MTLQNLNLWVSNRDYIILYHTISHFRQLLDPHTPELFGRTQMLPTLRAAPGMEHKLCHLQLLRRHCWFKRCLTHQQGEKYQEPGDMKIMRPIKGLHTTVLLNLSRTWRPPNCFQYSSSIPRQSEAQTSQVERDSDLQDWRCDSCLQISGENWFWEMCWTGYGTIFVDLIFGCERIMVIDIKSESSIKSITRMTNHNTLHHGTVYGSMGNWILSIDSIGFPWHGGMARVQKISELPCDGRQRVASRSYVF